MCCSWCNVLQCITVSRPVMSPVLVPPVLQCVVVRWGMSECVGVCWECVAACCSALQRVATRSSVLQCVSPHAI